MIGFASKRNSMMGPSKDGSMSARSGRASAQLSQRSSNLGGMSARGPDMY